ncbi:DUF3103 family protein [Alteromonas sp. a30]|uniref:DUF3103 family protein n=1 Tax=Alteromonas sp. a30 TaxID=2730917 RepID=UPI002282EAF2|nr:DUF3103 family protein [Alteromonas sp. a30]MCY7295721.1 DUF3103 family protein [Alteromonas sp. a30]
MKNLLVATLATAAALASTSVLAASEQALAKQLALKLQNSKDVSETVKQVAKAEVPLLIKHVLPNLETSRTFLGTGKTDVTEVWLHLPETRALGGDMSDLVVAFPPAGNESSWTEVTGYDLKGRTVSMDVNEAPDFPVIVVEDHGYHAMQRKLTTLNEALRQAGLQKSAPAIASATGFDAKKLTKIRLDDDQEPWVKGSAEIYGLVTGVLAGNEPQVVAVDMPYLDKDGTNYYPNQLFINWSQYEYQVVDMLLYEDDGDDVNYKELVKALITAVGAVGSLAGYPPVQAVAEITNRVIDATPSHWYTDDDDFVDACYTIEKFKRYTDYNCAGGNARVNMEHFFVQSN